MGGFGSGQRWSKKATVESRYSIDVATLKRRRLLLPGLSDHLGSFSWTRGGDKTEASVSYALTVGKTAGTLRLVYRVGLAKEDVAYPIRLVTTACHLGGVRWWFICPLSRNGVACGRRVRKLYLSGKYFGCRQCHNLTYTSCQESDSRAYALARGGVYAMGDPGRMSVTELGLALKALTIVQKRLDRLSGD
jgi:hypothetical protein